MIWQLTTWYSFQDIEEIVFKRPAEDLTHTFRHVLTANELRKKDNDTESFVHLMLVYAIWDLEVTLRTDVTELLVLCVAPVDSPLYNVLFCWNLTPHYGCINNPLRRINIVKFRDLPDRTSSPRG